MVWESSGAVHPASPCPVTVMVYPRAAAPNWSGGRPSSWFTANATVVYPWWAARVFHCAPPPCCRGCFSTTANPGVAYTADRTCASKGVRSRAVS